MVVNVQTPIKIVAIGLDLRSTKRLSTIFTVVYKGRCELVQGEGAVLAIVDLDNDTDAWALFQRKYSGLPVIIMSEKVTEIDGAIYIAKPAKLDPLWECINGLVNTTPPIVEVSINSDENDPVETSEHVENSDHVDDTTSSKVSDIKVNNTVQSVQRSLGTRPSQRAAMQALVDTSINDAASAMEAKISANSAIPNILQEKADPKQVSIYFDMDDYLLGHLISILHDNNNQDHLIHIHCWLDCVLILYPGEGKAYTNLSDSQFKYLGVVPCQKDFTVTKNPGSTDCESLSEQNKSRLQEVSIDYLLWDLALRTARGRVPQGTDLSRLHYLRCWPNFPRLPNTPHGMRMASVWVNNPCNLSDIAEKLNIATSDVYTFYSAALAIGLSGLAKRKADYLIESTVSRTTEFSKRGLFASIIRSLVNSGH